MPNEAVQGQVIAVDEAGLRGTIVAADSVFEFHRHDCSGGVVFNAAMVGTVVRFVADGRIARQIVLPPFDRHARAAAWASKHFGTRYRRY